MISDQDIKFVLARYLDVKNVADICGYDYANQSVKRYKKILERYAETEGCTLDELIDKYKDKVSDNNG